MEPGVVGHPLTGPVLVCGISLSCTEDGALLSEDCLPSLPKILKSLGNILFMLFEVLCKPSGTLAGALARRSRNLMHGSKCARL